MLSLIPVSPCNTLVVGDFCAVTGIKRVVYELCVGSHDSGARNVNSLLLLNLAMSRRLRTAGSWILRIASLNLVQQCWRRDRGDLSHTRRTLWRILQTCRVFQSAEFLATDHRLVVVRLRMHIRSKTWLRCTSSLPNVHLEKLRDQACAQWRSLLGVLEDTGDVWDTFKCENRNY